MEKSASSAGPVQIKRAHRKKSTLSASSRGEWRLQTDYTPLEGVDPTFRDASGEAFYAAMRAKLLTMQNRNLGKRDQWAIRAALRNCKKPYWINEEPEGGYTLLTIVNLARIYLEEEWRGPHTVHSYCKAWFLLHYAVMPPPTKNLPDNTDITRDRTPAEAFSNRFTCMIHRLQSRIPYQRSRVLSST
jgi:hypothetical protein